MSRHKMIRLTEDIYEPLDVLRGGVPRERYVRDVLQAHIEAHQDGDKLSQVATPSRERDAPESRLYRCPSHGCDLVTDKPTGQCFKHGRKVVPA